MTQNIRYEDWKAEKLKDPAVRAALEELEPAYQIARLRISRGLTQAQLAEMIGTKQSSIARLESGDHQPTIPFLRRIVEALGGSLEVKFHFPADSVSQVQVQGLSPASKNAQVQHGNTNVDEVCEQLFGSGASSSTHSKMTSLEAISS
ncbi:MAG: helix-turn-helix transcriptional regulator [Anaerolineales bacterium]|nr:helix-turn-helix transcriptional regulator [Anaerolineales bacterium]